jgi:hypothetical protein
MIAPGGGHGKTFPGIKTEKNAAVFPLFQSRTRQSNHNNA